MDPFEMLREDHRHVDSLIQTLQESDDQDERASTFEELEREFEVHAKIEEEVFYPALRKQAGLEDEVKDGREEHDEVRDRLKTMREQAVGDAPWLSALQSIKELIEHHVKDEEEEMFPQAQDKLDNSFTDALAKEMQSRKGQLMKQAV